MATLEELEARVQELEDDYSVLSAQNDVLITAIGKIKSCTCDPSKYASAEDYEVVYRRIGDIEDALGLIKSCTCDPSKYASQEEFAVEQSRRQELEAVVANIKSCTCDPSKYASKTEFQEVCNRIEDLEGYVEEATTYTTQKPSAMYEFVVPAGSASITIDYLDTIGSVGAFWDAVGKGVTVTVNGGPELETTSYIGGDTKTMDAAPYVHISAYYGYGLTITAYASVDQDISVDRHVILYGLTDVVETVKTRVSALNDKIGTLPDGQTVVGYVNEKTENIDTGVSREEVEGMIGGIDAGLTEDEVKALIGENITWDTLDESITNKVYKAQQTANDGFVLAEQGLLLAQDNAARIDDLESNEGGGSIDPDAIAQVISDLIVVGNKTLANALAEWAKSIPNYKLKFTARELEQKLSEI